MKPLAQRHEDGPTLADVAAAVEAATMEELAAVLAGWHPTFGLVEEPRFACVRCGAPRAGWVLSSSRWRCSDCGHTGTIFALRRLVLEDAEACAALLRLQATPVEYVETPALPDPWAS